MLTSAPWQATNTTTSPIPSARKLRSILVVDDEKRSQNALVSAVAARSAQVICASSVQAAKREIEQLTPELVLLDFALGDGDAFDLLSVLGALSPQPVVIIISGEASVEQSFRLAQCGVRTYLTKPFGVAELDDAIERSLSTCADLRAHARAAVGHRAIFEIENEIRSAMVTEALARARGNRRGAARLLAISRQSLQHMLRAVPGIADR